MKFPPFLPVGLVLLGLASLLPAREMLPRPSEAYFQPYEALAPDPAPGLYLKQGDRLAICGDSITEQKMYSRLIETYLTACVPELGVTCRQYGWSGEKASGLANRLENDVLRFQPTIATTCYGMNDHRYVPYTAEIGAEYVAEQKKIVRRLQEAGVRVVVGSPGTIGKMPAWVKTATGTAQDLNLSLLRLRNHDVELASECGVRFADVYWPMLLAGHTAQQKYGPGFMITGQDGVHPGWAGQGIMAYAFLQALGLDGNLGTIEWNATTGTAGGAAGHEIQSSNKEGEIRIRSTRYPFCVPPGDSSKDDSLQAGLELIPFHQNLNRFLLKVSQPVSEAYEVTWGDRTATFSGPALEKGINLAVEFPQNPFSAPFEKVAQTVLAKQEYETRQIKTLFHGPEGKADLEMTAALTEKARAPLAAAVAAAVVPLEHRLLIRPKP